ncbi:hypothetical protein BUQ74_20710 [Leptospira weilii serovar Heyan]|nr:hypothetical protein BUQ74_20710 [Leptospira weilii serovar Heyan]
MLMEFTFCGVVNPIISFLDKLFLALSITSIGQLHAAFGSIGPTTLHWVPLRDVSRSAWLSFSKYGEEVIGVKVNSGSFFSIWDLGNFVP